MTVMGLGLPSLVMTNVLSGLGSAACLGVGVCDFGGGLGGHA